MFPRRDSKLAAASVFNRRISLPKHAEGILTKDAEDRPACVLVKLFLMRLEIGYIERISRNIYMYRAQLPAEAGLHADLKQQDKNPFIRA